MGFFSKLFGGGERTSTSQSVGGWGAQTHAVVNRLAPFLREQIGKGLPAYRGERVAPLSGLEGLNLDKISKYLSQGETPELGMARGALKEAITSDYAPIVDPATTDALIARIKREHLKDAGDLAKELADQVNMSGMYWSGAHGRQQRELSEDTLNRLLDKVSEIRYSDELQRRDIAREREGRRFQAIPLAMDVSSAPIRETTAAMDITALPRLIEQMGRDTAYEDWLRTLPEYNPVLQMALALIGKPTGAQQITTSSGETSGGIFPGLGSLSGGVGRFIGSVKQ